MSSSKLNVLWVAPYPLTGASSRYRITQFLEPLSELGIDGTFIPLMEESFYQSAYQRGPLWKKAGGLAKRSLRRIADAVASRRFDLVVVQREAGLLGPPYFEALAGAVFGRPIVFDLDDPVFLNAQERAHSQNPILHRLVYDGSKAERIARMAKEVIVASKHAVPWAEQYCDSVTIIPTVVDGAVFHPIERPAPDDRGPIIGWVGSGSTTRLLDVAAPALQRLAQQVPFRLRLTGALADYRIPGVPIEHVRWDLQTETHEFARLDVGLHPQTDEAWTRHKPGFKAHIYMACGVAQVGSPIGDVVDFFPDGEAGYFARNDDEWFEHLRTLVTDAALRDSMGSRARAAFESGRNLQTETLALADVLRRAAGRAGG